MKIRNFMFGLLAVAVLASCNESDDVEATNDSLNATFKAIFEEESDLKSAESYQFKDDNTFVHNFSKGEVDETQNGTYTYSKAEHEGTLHYEDKSQERFTCSNDSIIHISSKQYCTSHVSGHENQQSHDSESHEGHNSENHANGDGKHE